MFGGIVETIGTILNIELIDGCKQFTITPQKVFSDLNIGDSVSVNGICLTVTQFDDASFKITAVPETLRLTNLNQLSTGSIVNLERSIKMSDRIGGHYLQGHIDTTGKILEIKHDNSNALLVKISIPETLAKYVINKGYISLDGMSITVIQAEINWFTVTFIPHTQAVTIVNQYKVNTLINIEVDMMAKYIEKILGDRTNATCH